MLEKIVLENFEEQVMKTPDNIATVFEDKNITYKELNEKANALAHQLRELGVSPNDYVAIMAERSLEMIVGIFGIIKSGGAFVPLDPASPVERMNYILGDCQPKVLLTNQKQLKIENDIKIINLTNQDVLSKNTKNPNHINQPSDLAYVIYTSGTTGRPKGVMVEHGNLSNYLNYAKVSYITKPPVVPLFTSYTFDLTITSIFLPLLCGGKMVIYNGEISEDIQNIFTNQEITFVKLTPSHLKMALLIDTDVAMNQLETLVLGGEELDTKSARQTLEKYGKQIKIHNEYGPTETTVGCCDYVYQISDNKRIAVSIGRPILNTQIYILNKLSICGIGATGELCIGGAGVTRGYLNQPELTSEKFIDNPYREGKLYRSGDLARWLPDGNIEYLGRIDEQVKIRGHRIETKEIENALLQVPNVSQAHVGALGEKGNQHLGAYYVSDAEISREILDNELKKYLPDYMMPTGYKHMSEFPLTINGKLDQRALPDIEMTSEVEYVAPQTKMEEIVAEGYKEILNLSLVGSEDNFFHLGGHSLRALRLVNHLELKTGKKLEVKHIFEAPKVSQLANLLETLDVVEYERIPKAPNQATYEMSSTQKRMYLLWKLSPNEMVYNMPAMFRFENAIDENKIREAIAKLTNRHEILRTRFSEQDGNLVQVISDETPIEISVENEKEEALSIWYEKSIQAFDLESGPLHRVKIARTEEADYLFVDMHHIISDGMSSTTFVEEFNLLVEGHELAPLDRQYKDYSEWFKNQDLSNAEKYWTDSLQDYPILELSTDYPRPKEQQFKGASAELIIDEATTNQIKNLIQKHNVTEYMFFMGLISILLGKIANQEELIIGSPVSGRSHKDTEKMLGMFVNTLALRVMPSSDKSFSDYLEEIKTQTLTAQEHQMYPFEDLVEKVVTDRDLSRHPLFDVMMVYQNNEEIDSLLGTGKWQQFDNLNEEIAKFDLTFALSNSEKQTYLSVNYATSLFKPETINVYLKRLEKLMNQVLNNQTHTIKELDCLLEEERELILTEFNDTYSEYPRDKTIVDVFEAQVEKTPGNIAVVFEDESITYKELNEKSNILAHELRRLGVKPDDYVAIMTERSIEMIIGIFGIIKAGGAYVPLDPSYPKERISYIVEDCQPKALLTNQNQLEVELNIPIINLAKHNALIGNIENLTRINQSSDLLYLIYTSGTTGKPKGVMVEHRNVVQLLINDGFQFDFDETNNWLMFHSFSFDVSVWEIFGALLNGAKLVVISREDAQDSRKVLEIIKEEKITVLNQVPTVFYNLESVADGEELSIRYIIFAGEALNPRKLKRWHELYPKTKIVNMYGITETKVHVT